MFPPVPKTGTVYDGAGLLSPDEEGAISELSRDYQRSTGSPIVVATLPSLDSVGGKAMGMERYSHALFDQWRIGNRRENGGILLVVAKADRKAWIALGKDWQHDYDAQAEGVLKGTILPLFKKGRYAEGIREGCVGLSHIAQLPPGANAGPSGPAADPAPFDTGPGMAYVGEQPEAAGGFPWGGLVCLGAPVLLIVLVVAAVKRGRRGYGGGYGGPSGTTVYNDYNDPRDDTGAFVSGVVAGQMMSQPTYDPAPYDPGPSYDATPSYDSGSGFDSGSSSDSGSFDSGSSGGGGAGGDW